jgi:hypothetical protein
MSNKPKLAEVITLYNSNSRNIPATLRIIADQIESGNFGVVTAVTLVTHADKLDVCHLGKGTSTDAHLLLCLGQRKLEQMVIRRIEDET